MNLPNAEMFGDINTGLCQNVEDCQTLFRMNTNDLLMPPQGDNMDDILLNDFFCSNGIVDMECVKYETDTKPLPMMYGEEKPNHFKNTPVLDDFTHSMQNFTVGISGTPIGATSWSYSAEQKKLFVKKKTPVTFDVSFSQPTDGGILKLRIMLVYSNPQFAYNTITRCQDDISKDRAKDCKFREHVVRCLNPEVLYIGRESGVNFEDRLAVFVTLNNGGAQTQQILQTVPVSLEFLCQNSCSTMERRATSLVFTLENEHGTLLGRKSISVKICSCPKRDMEKEGKKAAEREANKKRRSQVNETVVSSTDLPPRKKSRQSNVDAKPTLNGNISSTSRAPSASLPMPSSSVLGQVKREPSFTTLGRSLSNMSNSSMVDNDNSAVVLTLRLPDFGCAADVAMYAFKHLSSILVSCKDEQEKARYAQYLSHCRRVKPVEWRGTSNVLEKKTMLETCHTRHKGGDISF